MPDDILASDPLTGGNQGSGQVAGAKATTFIDDISGASEAPKPENQSKDPAGEVKTGAKATDPVLPGWANATTKELRADPRFSAFAAKFTRFDDAVKSAMELESKIGGMVSLPGEKSTPEESAAFYEKFGVPKDPAGYKFELSPELEYDEAGVAGFKDLAHKLHLSQSQAEGMLAEVGRKTAEILKASEVARQEKIAADKTEIVNTLKKEFGSQFDEQNEYIKRGFKTYATPELITELREAGLGNSIQVIKFFSKLGQMTREDSAAFGKSGDSGKPKSLEETMYPSK